MEIGVLDEKRIAQDRCKQVCVVVTIVFENSEKNL